MTAASPEIAIGGAGDFGLLRRNWFDNDAGLGYGLVKTAAGDRTFAVVNDNGGFVYLNQCSFLPYPAG
jgi:hypothetical protein